MYPRLGAKEVASWIQPMVEIIKALYKAALYSQNPRKGTQQCRTVLDNNHSTPGRHHRQSSHLQKPSGEPRLSSREATYAVSVPSRTVSKKANKGSGLSFSPDGKNFSSSGCQWKPPGEQEPPPSPGAVRRVPP